MDIVIQPAAARRGVARAWTIQVPPLTALVVAWAEAVRQGRLDLAATHRRRLDAIAAEEPTWEDAEWR